MPDSDQSAPIVHVITGLGDGGAQAVLYRLCSNDSAHRHVVVSLDGEDKYAPLLREAGIETICLDVRQRSFGVLRLWRLWSLLRRHRPFAIQTWMYHADLVGGVAGYLAGSRRICWGIRHTELRPGSSRRGTVAIARLCARLSRRIPNRIVCCARRARQVHAELGYARAKMVVIPNGFDTAKLAFDSEARTALRIAWEVDDDISLIGMVGRFDPQKDHQSLFRALARLVEQGDEFRLVLVGNGMTADNATLTGMIPVGLPRDRILFAGPRNDIPHVMSALDLHVLSSSYGEAFPNVIAEAMAGGTPCVATDVGDVVDIIGEAGWVVPPGQPAALADAIGAALIKRNEPEAWGALCDAAQRRIENNYGIATMVSRYHEVWRGEENRVTD